LGEDFDSLRQELDTPLPSMESPSDTFLGGTSTTKRPQTQQAAISRRNQVAKELDDMLEQIRQLPGFQTFFRAESEQYFLSEVQEGPIVVLNGTELRSDAILLTKARVTSIPTRPFLSSDC